MGALCRRTCFGGKYQPALEIFIIMIINLEHHTSQFLMFSIYVQSNLGEDYCKKDFVYLKEEFIFALIEREIWTNNHSCQN